MKEVEEQAVSLAWARRLRAEQAHDRQVHLPAGSGKKSGLGRKLGKSMFKRDRQWAFRRNHADRCKQRGERQHVQQSEENDRELEALPAASGRIIEDLWFCRHVLFKEQGELTRPW